MGCPPGPLGSQLKMAVTHATCCEGVCETYLYLRGSCLRMSSTEEIAYSPVSSVSTMTRLEVLPTPDTAKKNCNHSTIVKHICESMHNRGFASCLFIYSLPLVSCFRKNCSQDTIVNHIFSGMHMRARGAWPDASIAQHWSIGFAEQTASV